MIKKTFFTFLIAFVFVTTAKAQLRCESLFERPNQPFQQVIKELAYLEFSSNLYDNTVEFMAQVFDPTLTPTPEQTARYISILNEWNQFDNAQKKNVQQLLGHSITGTQATALKLVRALGRNEQGLNSELPGYQNNYTQLQIARKDRALEMAGFSETERILLLQSENVQDVLTKYTADDFIKEIGRTSAEQSALLNKQVISEANKLLRVTSKSSRKKQVLTFGEASQLLNAVKANPVAKQLNSAKYDPEGEIGFCFGRAMTAHLEALASGVDKESIRKAFVAGQMQVRNSDITWQFHVTMIVKGTKGAWWVIDPLFDHPIKLEEWYEIMSSYDSSGQLRLFVTEASRFGAISSDWYKKGELMIDFYNDYFKDLIEYFKHRSLEEKIERQKTMFQRMKDLLKGIW